MQIRATVAAGEKLRWRGAYAIQVITTVVETDVIRSGKQGNLH